jgi:hypothetical protein
MSSSSFNSSSGLSSSGLSSSALYSSSSDGQMNNERNNVIRARRTTKSRGIDNSNSAMALRALATRAGEAGRELMGVHTHLHQQGNRIEKVESMVALLKEGFQALTDDQDKEGYEYQINLKINTIEERQIRILRRIKAFKSRLESEMITAKNNNVEINFKRN